MNWILKAAAQKVISCLPAAHRINFLLQRYITVGKELSDAFVLDRLAHARKHVQALERFHPEPIDAIKILEIGTGWFPIVPIALFLMGADAIETTDIRQLYNRISINQTLRAMLRLHAQDRLRASLPGYDAARITRLQQALSVADTSAKLSMLHIQSTVSRRGQMPIADNSKDLIVSNNTLQYFPEDALDALLMDLRRIGKPQAILSLSVDLTDEFAQFDASIGPFNFYKYSEPRWRRLTSHLGRLNRLRCSDYECLWSKYQFQILESVYTKVDGQTLQKMQLDPHFSHYSPEDLRTAHAHWIATITE